MASSVNENIRYDDCAFEVAWDEFVQEDEAMMPPPSLEQRTIAAWEASLRITADASARRPYRFQGRARSPNRSETNAPKTWLPWQRPSQRYIFWSVGAAAAALLLAISLHRSVLSDDRAPAASSAASLGARETEVSYRWQRTSPLQGAVITLAVDPILETETLQLVRVRMPRLALQAVGVMVGEPDAEGFVEVDLLVGEDGLPRDVRRVSLTQE